MNLNSLHQEFNELMKSVVWPNNLVLGLYPTIDEANAQFNDIIDATLKAGKNKTYATLIYSMIAVMAFIGERCSTLGDSDRNFTDEQFRAMALKLTPKDME